MTTVIFLLPIYILFFFTFLIKNPTWHKPSVQLFFVFKLFLDSFSFFFRFYPQLGPFLTRGPCATTYNAKCQVPSHLMPDSKGRNKGSTYSSPVPSNVSTLKTDALQYDISFIRDSEGQTQKLIENWSSITGDLPP